MYKALTLTVTPDVVRRPRLLMPTPELQAGFLFFMEGQAAAIAGDPVSANPYPVGSPPSAHWMAGWNSEQPAHDPGKIMQSPTT